jgi:hypothetical protein
VKTLAYGQIVEISGLRCPYQLILDQKGYRASRGLPFADEYAKDELRRGGRSVGFVEIDEVQKPVDHTLLLGELVQVNGVVYTVTAPGVGDGDSASLILASP